MNRYVAMTAALALAGTAVLTSSPAGASTSGGGWGKAEEVPGLAALNTNGGAQVVSVSCASAGNCGAGGYYAGGSGQQAFVVSQVNGAWGKAEEVPGLAALNIGADAEVVSVSCASAGNCSAGGYYGTGTGEETNAFVVSQVNGVWGKAEEVPGTAAINSQGIAGVSAVSCTSAGNCVAGGGASTLAFVASQVNGTWRKAKVIHGTAEVVAAVSCASAGNCTAGGNYATRSGGGAFVVSQVHGTWGKAEELPGTARLDDTNEVSVSAVSCASAGNCSLGGGFSGLAFVDSQVNGTWGKAKVVNGDGINSVSCGSAGNCSAGGDYSFVISQVNGTWGKEERIRGIPSGDTAGVNAVSCASAGNCSAGGSYNDVSGHSQAFVVNQVNGTWQTAEQVPGTGTLNSGGYAAINALSCASAGHCSAGGYYRNGSGEQAFVVSRT